MLRPGEVNVMTSGGGIAHVEQTPRDVVELLAAKVASGVNVRVRYDPSGSLRMLRRRYVRAMRNAGVEMFAAAVMRHDGSSAQCPDQTLSSRIETTRDTSRLPNRDGQEQVHLDPEAGGRRQ